MGMAWRLMIVLILALCLIPAGSHPAGALSVEEYFTYGVTVEFSKAEIQGDEVFSATVEGTATCIKDLLLPVTEANISSRIVAEHQVSGAEVTLNSGYSVTLAPFPNEAGETSQASAVVSLRFPEGSESGVYDVVAELVEARILTPLGEPDVTSLLPASQALGSVTYIADGVGGGGIIVDPDGDLSEYVNEDGVFTADITVESEDGECWLTIEAGITGLTEDGDPLSGITVVEMEAPPPLPEDFPANVIGLTYDIGPDGATFDSPITLTLTYDESLLPEGVAEGNLVVAFWDEDADEWVELVCVVGTESNTIVMEINHFTPFTILAYTRPAAFTASDLVITPAEVSIGGEVTISLLITNSGDLSGSYEATLKIDDVVVATEEVTLAGGDSVTVSFSVAPDAAGIYAVDVGGLSGTFEVKIEIPPSATFAAVDLTISPAEVNVGESVTVSVIVTNTSGITGTYEVTFYLDDVNIETKEVTLAGGEGQLVTFTIAKGTAGSYMVAVDGLSGSFVVKEEPSSLPSPSPIDWSILIGVIAAVVIVGLLIFALAQRGHTESRDKDS